MVTYEFNDPRVGYKQAIAWEGRNWHRRGFEGSTFGILFYGDRGSLSIENDGYVISDPKGVPTATVSRTASDMHHLQNFVEGVRGDAALSAQIEEGVKSTLLCHLGNIAYRTGHPIVLDVQSHQIVGNAQASSLWSRQYEPGWTLDV